MRQSHVVMVVLLGFATASVASPSATTAPDATPKSSGYHLLHSYKLGGDGSWDYLKIDSQARRLYISHSTRVVVMNADDGSVVGEVPNTNGVHGIALAADLGRGFTSNGRDTTVTIFDIKSLKVLSSVKVTGAGPDAILYDATTHHVFTFNGRGHNATAIDAATGVVAGTIDLGGVPEFAVTGGDGRIYVNIEDKSELVVLDPAKLAVVSRWPLAPGEEPTGLALDVAHQLLFSVCANQKMEVVDAKAGKIIATLPIGRGVDAAGFDPETALAFSSNGEGTLTVIHEDDASHFTVVDTVPTQRGARTMALDLSTHEVYLATAEFGPAPEATPENPRPRPPVVPGSFVILVFGQ